MLEAFVISTQSLAVSGTNPQNSRIQSKFAEAHNAKAVTLSQKRENKKALDVVNKAIELDPAIREAHEKLGKLILTSSNIREIWRFWMTPKKRLAVQIMHGVLAVGLVLYSFYTDSE